MLSRGVEYKRLKTVTENSLSLLVVSALGLLHAYIISGFLRKMLAFYNGI